MNLYRSIFKEAFFSVWKNKYLWFFGLFATLIGGLSEVEIIFRNTDSDYSSWLLDFRSWMANPIFTRNGWINIGQHLASNPLETFVLISILLAVMILLIFMVWITIVSQTALVYNSAKIMMEKSHSFKEGLQSGMNKFWPVLTLNFCLKIFLSFLFLLFTGSAFASSSSMGVNPGSLVYVILFIVFIPLSIIFSFIIKYAIAYVVIKDEKILKSIKSGWELFLKNWLVSIEMAFMLFLISFVAALLLILLFLILAIPILLGGSIIVGIFNNVNFALIIIGAAVIFYIVAIIAFGSFVTAFQINAWTNLFLELIGKGGVSKLNRIFKK